jgi:catechol 2,3-dioxygenase-like lactoylglutathione lyase family enzyme
MAKPVKLAHVVYMTRRFDEMLDWYREVFEAVVQYRDPAFAFLTFDDEHHRFAFADMSVISPEGAASELAHGVGVNHVGYTYENVGDLLETYARLKDSGITPYWQVHHGLTLSAYYRDPDGNRMEFQVDCCAEAREAHALMRGEAFARNPVGVEVDFDALLARHRGGVPAEALLARPEGPASQIPPAHGLS